MNAISLFSSAGIGDLGVKANNINIVASCEILKNRHELFSNNHSNAKCFTGDIWDVKDDIVEYYNNNFDEELFLLMATPPCQGMSQNGAGKLLNEYRKGKRKKLDERNQLIIPAIEIALKLKPKWIILENVTNMTNTLIEDEDGNLVNIIEYIKIKLTPLYIGKEEIVEIADFGIPQSRKRLITIFTKTLQGIAYFEKFGTFLPNKTHKNNWITLREAIGNIPKLDAKKGYEKNEKFHKLHVVPILKEDHYHWIKNTKEGDTAFNNQCINPLCLYQFNSIHGTSIQDGINKSNKDTPVYCEKCGDLLPRPWVYDKNNNKYRLMKGYTSAYKRMNWNQPASTLTQNFQFACSDNKIHPDQNRVLSIYEALIIQSIDKYEYSFEIGNKMSKIGLIRESIGESVPPKLIDKICENIITIMNNEYISKLESIQLTMF